MYSTNIECFVVDSSCLHLTFVAFYLLFVICRQQLNQYNNYVEQSELLIKILDRFHVISMEFLSLRCRCLLFKMSILARSKRRWLFSQAN